MTTKHLPINFKIVSNGNFKGKFQETTLEDFLDLLKLNKDQGNNFSLKLPYLPKKYIINTDLKFEIPNITRTQTKEILNNPYQRFELAKIILAYPEALEYMIEWGVSQDIITQILQRAFNIYEGTRYEFIVAHLLDYKVIDEEFNILAFKASSDIINPESNFEYDVKHHKENELLFLDLNDYNSTRPFNRSVKHEERLFRIKNVLDHKLWIKTLTPYEKILFKKYIKHSQKKGFIFYSRKGNPRLKVIIGNFDKYFKENEININNLIYKYPRRIK